MSTPTTTNATISTQPFSKWFEVHPGLGISMMDHLFNRLDGAYPDKWKRNFPNQQAIDNWSESWAEAFEEDGITPHDIKAGLRACRTRYDWPPSCAEFIKACKPSIDPTVAYYQAVAGIQARERGDIGDWSHPAIFWASAQLTFELKNQTYSTVRARWESALKAEMEKGEWPEIPKPALALSAPARAELSREQSAKRLAELQATTVTKRSDDRVDHLLWAKRLLRRHKEGDKSIPTISLQFAREAMGLRA